MNVKTKAFDYTEALKSESKKYKICSVVLFCIGIGLFLAFFMMVSILFRLPFTFSEYGIFSRSIAVFFIIIMIINSMIGIIIMRTLGFIFNDQDEGLWQAVVKWQAALVSSI